MKQLTDNIKAILAIIVVVLGISYFYMCSLRDIKPDPQILIAIVGSVGTCLGYYFGSSSSKSEPTAKTDTGDITVKQ
jgi:hypothetical protein